MFYGSKSTKIQPRWLRTVASKFWRTQTKAFKQKHPNRSRSQRENLAAWLLFWWNARCVCWTVCELNSQVKGVFMYWITKHADELKLNKLYINLLMCAPNNDLLPGLRQSATSNFAASITQAWSPVSRGYHDSRCLVDGNMERVMRTVVHWLPSDIGHWAARFNRMRAWKTTPQIERIVSLSVCAERSFNQTKFIRLLNFRPTADRKAHRLHTNYIKRALLNCGAFESTKLIFAYNFL